MTRADPPGLALAAIALRDLDDALRVLRQTTNALTHPASRLRRQLREVEICLGTALRALARARGSE